MSYVAKVYRKQGGEELVVRVWPGYFHKNKVGATYEELRGIALNQSTGGQP